MLAFGHEADVLLDSLHPGALERYGLGADDHIVQAATGMTMLTGCGSAPPIRTGLPTVDASTGMHPAQHPGFLARARCHRTQTLHRHGHDIQSYAGHLLRQPCLMLSIFLFIAPDMALLHYRDFPSMQALISHF